MPEHVEHCDSLPIFRRAREIECENDAAAAAATRPSAPTNELTMTKKKSNGLSNLFNELEESASLMKQRKFSLKHHDTKCDVVMLFEME